MNSFLNFFAFRLIYKKNKRLKAPHARTIENRAKILKADWFKNDMTHVLVKIVSPLGRVGYHFSHFATIRYTTIFYIIKCNTFQCNEIEVFCLKVNNNIFFLFKNKLFTSIFIQAHTLESRHEYFSFPIIRSSCKKGFIKIERIFFS